MPHLTWASQLTLHVGGSLAATVTILRAPEREHSVVRAVWNVAAQRRWVSVTVDAHEAQPLADAWSELLAAGREPAPPLSPAAGRPR